MTLAPDSSPEPPKKEHGSAVTMTFDLVRYCDNTSDLQNYEIIDGYYFKPLNVW